MATTPDPHWPHAPLHRLGESGVYFVTVGTYLKAHRFRGAERLAVLHRGLLAVTTDFGWQAESLRLQECRAPRLRAGCPRSQGDVNAYIGADRLFG